MRKRGLLLAFVLAVAGLEFAAAQTASSSSSGADSMRGAIVGRVSGPSGPAQAGVPVTITSRDGRFSQKVETQAGGGFSLPRLAPGVYSVEVLLPTFLPFWKAPIHVLPGAQVLLDINLRALADSVDVSWPEDPAGARDDWKWVLRSGAASRPILRFLEEAPAANGGASPEDETATPLHGTVQFVAGSDSRGFASDPGLRTSFDMEYGTAGPDTLGVSGSAGWEQGTPAAAFRAAWNRKFGDQANTTFSTAVRQVFLPAEYWRSIGGGGESTGERMQSVTLGYEHESAPTSRLRMRYGAFVDTVSVGSRMTRWNPFGQVTYAHSASTRLLFSYAGAAPRVLPSETDYRQQKSDQWLAIPQMSSGADLHPVLEEGSHLEAGLEQDLGARYRVQAGVFYDSLSDLALSMTGQSAAFLPGLLRDPFSNRYFLSGGNYSGAGARASFAAVLSENSDVVVGYSYAQGLQAVADNLVVESRQALRAKMEAGRGHSFSVKASTTVPAIDTRVITSYRWLPGGSVAAPDPYDQSMGRAEPYLNVVFLQPIPAPNILPGQFEAVLDIRNLLAEGYLLVQTPEGGRSLLFPAARAFRGGFNFIF